MRAIVEIQGRAAGRADELVAGGEERSAVLVEGGEVQPPVDGAVKVEVAFVVQGDGGSGHRSAGDRGQGTIGLDLQTALDDREVDQAVISKGRVPLEAIEAARDDHPIGGRGKGEMFVASDTPAILADVDVVNVDRARTLQRENGTPFFLTLAREESIALDAATDLMREHGQKLFSQLWTAPRVWIVFEKNTDALADLADLPGDPDVRDWVLETLRLVQDLEQQASFDSASIPAYTKDGFERVQRLKLTSDEAQFASQFNGARTVQQIAKNLRLDLKSARQLMFRFLALEIVECWPGSTAAKPQKQSFFKRRGRRDR